MSDSSTGMDAVVAIVAIIAILVVSYLAVQTFQGKDLDAPTKTIDVNLNATEGGNQ